MFIGPQIPRGARPDTRERYCRAILTLFRPWLTFNDLCNVSETWNDALKHHENDFSASSNRIIENIELMHECKNDRDEHLVQIIDETEQTDPIAVNLEQNYQAVNDLDKTDELLELIDFDEEIAGDDFAHDCSTTNDGDLYVKNAIRCIVQTERFVPTKDDHCRQMIPINVSGSHQTPGNTLSNETYYIQATNEDIVLNTRWQQLIKQAKSKARENILNGCEGKTSPNDINSTYVDEVTSLSTESHTINDDNSNVIGHVEEVTSKDHSKHCPMDVSRQFKLNYDQNRAFTLITDHVDGKRDGHEGIYPNEMQTSGNYSYITLDNCQRQLLMCISGPGGTGKSQVINAVTKYFQVTNRG